MFLSDIEPLLVKKIAYRYFGISELIAKPDKLKLLYIARQGEWRQILNERDMIRNITSKCKDVVEFEKAYFERNTHRMQVLSMRSTDILLGYHGAAFVNIMFMMPYSGFIEFFSPLLKPRYYDMMAQKTQLAYRSLTGNNIDLSKKPPRDGRNINMYIDVNMVVEYVNELVEIVNKEKYKIVSVI